MVGLLTWGSKQHVQGFADDLGDGAIMGKHDIGHAREVLIEQWPEYAGLQRLDECRETSDVGEKCRDLTALPTEIDGISIPGKAMGDAWRGLARNTATVTYRLVRLLPVAAEPYENFLCAGSSWRW